MSILNDLLIISKAHIAVSGTMLIAFQLYGYSLVLAERMSFLNVLGHWKSRWGKDLRLCLRNSTHLRVVEVLLLWMMWNLSSPVSRVYRPIVVLSSP